MIELLKWSARAAGLLGVVLVAASVAVRLAGSYSFGSFQVGTVMQAGMAAMLFACLAYLAIMAERPLR
jgi:hypothetical protein